MISPVDGQRPSRKPVVMDAVNAAELIRHGDRVVVGASGGAPRDVLRALSARIAELRGVTLICGVLNGIDDIITPTAGRLNLLTWMSPPLGSRILDQAIDILPLSWFRAVGVLSRSPIDVAVVQVSPPGASGHYSLGVSVSYTMPLLRKAELVIAEVNPQMPRTLGNSFVHESELDVVVPVDYPLLELVPGDVGDTGREIAAVARPLIPAGVTLQIGVGSLPAAAALALADRGDEFAVYSLLSDASAALIRGSTAGRRTRPPALIGEISGSRALYGFVHENPAIFMDSAPSIHSQHALHEMAPLVGINAALQVDLYGQINSEYLNGQRVSGIGGALDFIIATYDDANRVLVLLRSDHRGTSAIVPILKEPPSVGRALAPIVVTEWGAADLRGLTVEERAGELIRIAHPDHQAKLRRAWASMVR